jgi:hypothetical protein
MTRTNRIWFSLAMTLCVVTSTSYSKTGTNSADDYLVKIESQKWTPQTFKSPAEFMALFAPDFVSVEYGADVTGGVQRKTREQVFSGGPLPPATFDLRDFKIIHPSADTAIVSYKVIGKSFKWQAYATSVWARRAGKWVTVFYQASTAK